MRQRSMRVFLALSLVIAVIDAVFVIANVHFARQALDETVTKDGQAARAVFEAALEQSLRDMSSLATFIAGDRDVQRMFREGRDAVRAEGGGPGGQQAAVARAALMAKVAPSWRVVQERFAARQLHFHLGPGSLSFLRVHAPTKFGDRMDGLRHLITATDAKKAPQSGFEMGRIYAGLRGAVPVFYRDDDDERDYLGVLEVGTSMQPLLATIARSHGWSLAALLSAEHVDAAMWRDYRAAMFPDGTQDCGCVVEASTSPAAVPLVQALRTEAGEGMTPASAIVSWEGRMWAVTRFPLSDFLAQQDPGRGPVGVILMWRDATPMVAALEHANTFNVIYAVGAFLLLEVLLLITFRVINRRLRSEISDKTSALARSNRDLEEFVYVASHDLREPLRMVASYLGLVSRRYGDGLDDRGREFIDHATQGARRMDAMIHDLLELSRVTTRGATMAPLPLSDALAEAQVNLTVALRESRAQVEVKEPLPTITGDRTQIVRLLQNLLSNGLKYQPPGQAPHLTVWSDQDDLGHCRLHVGDNGIGIAADQQDRIFLMFQRLHGRGEYEGSGIGLAICRRIVERHGGTLSVASTPGKGSVFTVTLPCTEL